MLEYPEEFNELLAAKSVMRVRGFVAAKPSGQYVDKNNSTRDIRDGNEWEGISKPLIFLGGCNFGKGNYLRFCRECNSQCGGQGFDPPLLHQHSRYQIFTALTLIPLIFQGPRHEQFFALH